MICNTCKHKDLCKKNMKSYGVEFVRISECKEYEMNNEIIIKVLDQMRADLCKDCSGCYYDHCLDRKVLDYLLKERGAE